MAFKVRLARHGSKGRPFYWIMAADARSPRETGKEKLGTYDPLLEHGHPRRLVLKVDRIRYWLSCGAQPTDRVKKLLSLEKIIEPVKTRETPIQSAPKKKNQARLAEKQKEEALKREQEEAEALKAKEAPAVVGESSEAQSETQPQDNP